MQAVKWRIVGAGLAPRRTELEIPGWAGAPEPRSDGSPEHPWHCVPFSEAARYGIEVLFPFAYEARIATRGGRLVMESDAPDDAEDGPPPVVSVAERFYLYPFTLDLRAPEGWAIRTEPHPSFFTDPTHSTPIAIPGLVRTSWWPMATSLVFKAPAEGQTHVFRPGAPFVQVILVPETADYEIDPMSPEEAAERELQARRIEQSRDALAERSRWTSSSGIGFDGAYRHMLRAAKARDTAAAD